MVKRTERELSLFERYPVAAIQNFMSYGQLSSVPFTLLYTCQILFSYECDSELGWLLLLYYFFSSFILIHYFVGLENIQD